MSMKYGRLMTTLGAYYLLAIIQWLLRFPLQQGTHFFAQDNAALLCRTCGKSFWQRALKHSQLNASEKNCVRKWLDASLTDIDHRGRSGGQRILLPISVTRENVKPIVEEQGFHLLGKDIAQGS